MVEVFSLINWEIYRWVEKMKKRIEYIDKLKGVAMLMVVVGHLLSISFGNSNGNPLFVICETIQMTLFSFLSGFVIQSMSFGKVVKKLPQFLLPMIIVGVLYTYYTNRTIIQFLHSPFKHGYWYFLFLIYCYLCVSVISCISYRFKREYLNALQDLSWLVFFYASFKILETVTHVTWSRDLFSLQLFSGYWPCFMLGIIARKYNFVTYLAHHNIIFSGVLLMYVPFAFWYSLHGGMFKYLAAFCAIISLLYLFYDREGKHSLFDTILSFVGKTSIDVYLFHFFFLNAINLSVLGEWFDFTQNYLLESLLVTTIALLISYISIIISKVIKKSVLLTALVYGKVSC